jgi:hypothetical protein
MGIRINEKRSKKTIGAAHSGPFRFLVIAQYAIRHVAKLYGKIARGRMAKIPGKEFNLAVNTQIGTGIIEQFDRVDHDGEALRSLFVDQIGCHPCLLLLSILPSASGDLAQGFLLSRAFASGQWLL